jgi:hypothetical protein
VSSAILLGLASPTSERTTIGPRASPMGTPLDMASMPELRASASSIRKGRYIWR